MPVESDVSIHNSKLNLNSGFTSVWTEKAARVCMADGSTLGGRWGRLARAPFDQFPDGSELYHWAQQRPDDLSACLLQRVAQEPEHTVCGDRFLQWLDSSPPHDSLLFSHVTVDAAVAKFVAMSHAQPSASTGSSAALPLLR